MNGTITESVGSLTFTRAFLNAGIGVNAHEFHDDEFIDSSLYVPFRGTWSNGWYSTGEFSVTTVTSGFFGNGILNITTIVTPEPSSLTLLGGGTLAILGIPAKAAPLTLAALDG